jgi:predicted dehydrogenase
MTGAPLPPAVRAGLIGYGYAGKTFHAPLINAAAGLTLVGVASSNAAKVHADLPNIPVDSSAEALIDNPDIDLVVIATPNDTHAPLALAALQAGKHVVIDKPFALDLAEARQVVSTAARHDRFLSVFHNRRWDSDFLTVRQAIADGLIGNVTHFESHFDRFRPQVQDRWREQDSPGGGLWFDLGPHLVDQALCLFGLPDRVQAAFARQRAGAQADDWAHVILSYGDRRVILQAGMLVAGGTHRFSAHGPHGSIVKQQSDRQEAQLLAGMTPGASGWGNDPDALMLHDGSGIVQNIAASPGDQRHYYNNVADAISQGGPNPVAPVEALAVMAVIEATFRSAKAQATSTLALTQHEQAQFIETLCQVAPCQTATTASGARRPSV